MEVVVQVQVRKEDLVKVPISMLFANRHRGIDIYLLFDDKPLLYKDANLPITNEKISKLYELGITNVYISREDIGGYLKDLENELETRLLTGEPSLENLKRTFEILETLTDILLVTPDKDNLVRAESVSKKVIDYIEQHPRAAYLVAFVLQKDFKTAVHSTNVYFLTSGFAYHLGYRNNDLEKICVGAFFHDIGKAKLPKEILEKDSELHQQEYELLKKHTIFGYELLIQNELQDYAFAAYEHHELLDGSGYPRGLKNGEISTEAQIIQICDVYEAVTGYRPYKKSWTAFKALSLIRDDFVLKSKMDRDLYEEFVVFLFKNRM
ncbi:metal dependent phosphohydrolase [Thermosulfidibacter takaii ABI70S6]|uniref:Metal dependent phosphohydrolase n=1 Tax=Thermosulfidibacter takaii (strain DSM 17441 / JCM 13301 / NBRC 103674 / ABI70S6) TaxID=1298851 RepID=A0A0S3QRL0_THET7|nr:metal dependent phosphohydrolase [Thermosulfidibacter takaii ABI70S6]